MANMITMQQAERNSKIIKRVKIVAALLIVVTALLVVNSQLNKKDSSSDVSTLLPAIQERSGGSKSVDKKIDAITDDYTADSKSSGSSSNSPDTTSVKGNESVKVISTKKEMDKLQSDTAALVKEINNYKPESIKE